MKTSIPAMLALVLTVPMVFAGSSTQDEPKSGSEPEFSQVDINTDGAISVEEARNVGITDDEFKAHDTDYDDLLNEVEYLALSVERETNKESGEQTQ